MSKKRKKEQKKKLANIGKEKYNFDIVKEREIYSYLSCYPMEKISIDDTYKFDSYKKWKDYILHKYKIFDNNELEEFYRYLNLLDRKKEFSFSYWNILIPIFLTVFADILFEAIRVIMTDVGNATNTTMGMWELLGWVMLITIIRTILILCFVYIFIYILKQTMEPLEETDNDHYLLTDYKEVIVGMMEEKKQM